MGNAGRVLMIPKGDYNPATPYEMLDCVYYNGRSYVCKQASTGHAPTDIMYWQPMTPDSSAEIQALTNYVCDNGVKNIWNIKALASATHSGVTYTVNSDGTVDAVGTLTSAESVFPLSAVDAITSYDLKPNTTYKISLGITLSATRRIEIFIKETDSSSWSQVVNQNTGTEAEYTTPASWYLIWIRFNATGNGTAVNEKLYPMIRENVITDPTYQPYAKTNVELTQESAYHKGDTIAFTSHVNAFPCIYTSAKKIRTYVKLDKPIGDDVSALTFANSYVEVWGDGVDYNVNADVTEVACSFAKGESGIIIVLTADITSQGYTANNNYICILNGTLTLS